MVHPRRGLVGVALAAYAHRAVEAVERALVAHSYCVHARPGRLHPRERASLTAPHLVLEAAIHRTVRDLGMHESRERFIIHVQTNTSFVGLMTQLRTRTCLSHQRGRTTRLLTPSAPFTSTVVP